MKKMTEANLQAAFAGESQAHMRYLIFAKKAEKVHSALYHQAKAGVTAGKDADIGEIYICEVCGWTGTGEKPDKCPLCRAQADRIRTF